MAQDFSKTGFKSFFAYFHIVDKDNSGILEKNEIEGKTQLGSRANIIIIKISSEVAKSMFGSGYEELFSDLESSVQIICFQEFNFREFRD